MYLHQKISTMCLLLTLLLLLRLDTGKVRNRFSGIGRFKGELRCKGRVNSVTINVITEINCRFNGMRMFFKI